MTGGFVEGGDGGGGGYGGCDCSGRVVGSGGFGSGMDNIACDGDGGGGCSRGNKAAATDFSVGDMFPSTSK